MAEITKTNFHMLRDFQDFKPAQFGILSGAECKKIREHFMIPERSNVELQNLRDFVVMFYTRDKKDITASEDMTRMDIMSGICGVIDSEKVRRGMPV